MPKTLLCILIVSLIFAYHTQAQEQPRPMVLEEDLSALFSWHTSTVTLSSVETPTTFSTEKANCSLQNLRFGYNGKQINSTSQFNHFSVLQDMKRIELHRGLDPFRNYPGMILPEKFKLPTLSRN